MRTRSLALASVLALTLFACDRSADSEAVAAVPVGDASSLTFDADGLPKFKPGAWAFSQTDDGESETYQVCLGAEATAEIREAVNSTPEGCTKDISRAGGALVVSGVCERGGIRSNMRFSVRGSDTRVSIAMQMSLQNAGSSEATPMEMKAEGRWIGPCPAGVEPGERIEE